jgi:UDPglucose--hexose-1-phosphate uridylyltransferase
VEPVSKEELESCPFCEGREDRTPPETFALADHDREPDTPGWQVRVVPNKYPAFEHHDVVVHTPRHARSLGELRPDEVALVARAWSARAEAARAEGYGYVQAVVNEGRDAGASLAHTHSQLVWLHHEPPIPAAERGAGGCAVCALLESDNGERLVLERDGVVMTCPYASRVRYELFVAPSSHEADAFDGGSLGTALELLAEGVRRIATLEGPIPLNAWLHTPPFGAEGHWHFELVPRLTIPASLELGAGVYITTLAPEQAAAQLRAAAA